MTHETCAETSTLCPERVDISEAAHDILSIPGKNTINQSDNKITVKAADDSTSTPRVDIPEQITATKAAELMGISRRSVIRNCVAGKYAGALKEPGNGGEGWSIPIASLPLHAQAKLAEEFKAQLAASVSHLPPVKTTLRLASSEYTALWEGYERSGATFKRMAEGALNAVAFFIGLVDSGHSKGQAETETIARFNINRVTLWRYRNIVKGHPNEHWLPLLAPKYKGGRPPAEFSPDAYEFIRANYLNTSGTPLVAVIESARISTHFSRQSHERKNQIPAEADFRGGKRCNRHDSGD